MLPHLLLLCVKKFVNFELAVQLLLKVLDHGAELTNIVFQLVILHLYPCHELRRFLVLRLVGGHPLLVGVERSLRLEGLALLLLVIFLELVELFLQFFKVRAAGGSRAGRCVAGGSGLREGVLGLLQLLAQLGDGSFVLL